MQIQKCFLQVIDERGNFIYISKEELGMYIDIKTFVDYGTGNKLRFLYYCVGKD